MSAYWGQPVNRDELGTLTRWNLRRGAELGHRPVRADESYWLEHQR